MTSHSSEFMKLCFSDEQIRTAAQLLQLPTHAFLGLDGKDPRQTALRTMETVDIAACPGSGKTTLLVAKLSLLEQNWISRTSGICVLSHTNVARQEVEKRLGNTTGGRRLLGYPHYIETIHAFVNEFLALPCLRSLGIPIKVIDNERALDRRWYKLSHAARSALERRNHGPATLIIRSADGTVGPVKWGKSALLGQDTPTYKEMTKVCRASVKDGFFCHEEMFVWAHVLLNRAPSVVEALRRRFPIVFMDEAQDNHEEQAAILKRPTLCTGCRSNQRRPPPEGALRPMRFGIQIKMSLYRKPKSC